MDAEKYPPLSPITSPWMQDVISDKKMLRNLFEQYGSPINLHHLGPFTANYEAYKSIFDRHQLKHNIFFARKANKCRAFPRQARRLGFGVDTASYVELKQCLELGCGADKLVLTAAIKDERLVRLALQHEVLIIIDNEDECRLVNRVASQTGKKATIGIRISGFRFKGQKLYSRFGFDIEDALQFVLNHMGPDNEFHNLSFSGFHFHLDGYSIPQRAEALMQTLKLADALQKHAITTSFIDIGGGFLTNYLSNGTQWEHFWDELKKAVKGNRRPITFNNNGLGYRLFENKLAGQPRVYPYFNETPKEQFLDKILSSQNMEGQTVASLLRKRAIELRIEPGRSLLDQAGMTIAKVAHRKQDQRGDWLVGLEMNRSQLLSSSEDFLLDPAFISMQPPGRSNNPAGVYFTGAYCLESDIILKRKIMLPRLPELGDVIAFPNSAGYMMHFYETRSHLHPFSTNLIKKPPPSAGFTLDSKL